jgi:toxin YoeB
MYLVVFANDFAENEYLELKKTNIGAFKKANDLIKELKLHPEFGTGQPEKLKQELTGLWSRRLNKKDRLIYEIDEEDMTVIMHSFLGHY